MIKKIKQIITQYLIRVMYAVVLVIPFLGHAVFDSMGKAIAFAMHRKKQYIKFMVKKR